MSFSLRRTFQHVTAIATLALSSVALAQSFPERAITVLVPYPAGGAADAHVRAIAEDAARTLGQSVVIQNVPGASGLNGANALLRAAPDGYTVAMLPAAMAREPHLNKVRYDPLTSFAFILLLSDYTQGFAVRSDAPWKTWQDFVADAARRPGKISVGVNGAIGAPRFVMEEAAEAARVELNIVPYKGEAEIAAAIIGGHLDAGAVSGVAAPHIEAGKLRYLAMLTEQPIKRYANVPTLRQLGINTWMSSPYGLAAPAGTDPAVIKVLHDVFRKGLESPNSVRAMEQLNQVPYYRGPDDYRAFIADMFAKEKVRLDRMRQRGVLN